MKPNWSVERKVKTGLAMGMVLFLILFTNRLDHQYYSSIEDSLKSIYDDRLMVQGYIHGLNKVFHRKQLTLFSKTHEYEVDQPDEIKTDTLLRAFSKTRLSRQESTEFDRLQHNIDQLRELEKGLSHKDSITIPDQKQLNSRLSDVQVNLDALADIQLKEGRLLLEETRSSLERNAMILRIEYVVLILVGLMLQFILINWGAGKRKKP
ncbi:MAG: hypothetical protein RIC95_07690 [Vicingaceae bacterium]